MPKHKSLPELVEAALNTARPRGPSTKEVLDAINRGESPSLDLHPDTLAECEDGDPKFWRNVTRNYGRKRNP